MIYIYNKNTLEKTITLNYTSEEFQGNEAEFYSEWNAEIMIYTNENLRHPKIENGILIEKSTDELKLEGIIPIENGELIAKGKIVIVPIPKNLIRPVWISPNWIEGITKEELTKMRKEKILNYENLKSEKTILENSEFSTTEETETLDQELEALKNEINEIALKIKAI